MVVRFSEHIEAEMPHLAPDQHEAVVRMMVVRGSAEIMHARGAQFGWTFAQVEEVRVLLARGGGPNTSAATVPSAGELVPTGSLVRLHVEY